MEAKKLQLHTEEINPGVHLFDQLNRFLPMRFRPLHCTQFILRLDREFSESPTGINSFDTAEISTRIEVYVASSK
jgi:hypothetical protein